jgi:hypothetical protein
MFFKVAGVLSASFGLSSAIFTEIFILFFKPHVLDFLFYLSIILGATACFSSLFIDVQKNPHRKEVHNNINTHETEQLLDNHTQTEHTPHGQSALREFNTLQMLRTVEFWMLWIVDVTVFGAGIALINNIGSIVLSLKGQEGQQDTFVLMLSST